MNLIYPCETYFYVQSGVDLYFTGIIALKHVTVETFLLNSFCEKLSSDLIELGGPFHKFDARKTVLNPISINLRSFPVHRRFSEGRHVQQRQRFVQDQVRRRNVHSLEDRSPNRQAKIIFLSGISTLYLLLDEAFL